MSDAKPENKNLGEISPPEKGGNIQQIKEVLEKITDRIDWAKNQTWYTEDGLAEQGIDIKELEQEIAEANLTISDAALQSYANTFRKMETREPEVNFFGKSTYREIYKGRENLQKFIKFANERYKIFMDGQKRRKRSRQRAGESAHAPEPETKNSPEPSLSQSTEGELVVPIKEEHVVEQSESKITLDPEIEKLKQELALSRERYAGIEAVAHPKWERLKKFFGKDVKKNSAELDEARDEYRGALRNYKKSYLLRYGDDNYQLVNLYREMAEEHILLYDMTTQKRFGNLESEKPEQPKWKKKLQELFPKVTQWFQESEESVKKTMPQALFKSGFFDGKSVGMLALLGKRYAEKVENYVNTYFGAGEAQAEKRKTEEDVQKFSYALAGNQLSGARRNEEAKADAVNALLNEKISQIDSKVARMAKTDLRKDTAKAAALKTFSALAGPVIKTSQEIEKRMSIERKVLEGSNVSQLVNEMIDELERKKGLKKDKYRKENGDIINSKEELLDYLLVNFAKAHKGLTHVLDKEENRILDKPIIEKGDTLSLRESKDELRLILDKPSRYVSGDEFFVPDK